MTAILRDRGVRAVLVDIEGTTTPISFVHDVLFPFARAHVRAYVRAHRESDELREVIRRLSAEHATDAAQGERPPDWQTTSADQTASLVAYVDWLMDRDRKSPGLKLLQGLIWEDGYQAGVLRGRVFADVPPAIRRWRQAGIDVAVYSSGSELAQRRLFESTEHGDLTPLVTAFFDTGAGAKTSADSYRRIAQTLGHPPSGILFISDVASELTAARAAGLQVVLSVRPGNGPQPGADSWPVIHGFDEITLG